VLSKHSGFPFSALIGSCDTNNDRNGDGYCPDLPFAYNGGAISGPTKQQWINGIFPNPTAEFDTTTRGPGRIFMPLPDVNASYDAAIFQLKHRFSGGLELASAYTRSACTKRRAGRPLLPIS
jgi:hypothetical protein